MEYCGRRNRRARQRNSYQHMPMQTMHFVQRPTTCDVLKNLSRFLLMVALSVSIGVFAIGLCKLHCKNSNKSDLVIIKRNINGMRLNISRLKDSYTDLEKTITKFAEEKPKIDVQIEMLQTLANILEKGDFVWYPKTDFVPPNVCVPLNEPSFIIPEEAANNKNITFEKTGQLNDPIVRVVEKDFYKNFTSIV
ncbi:uncharacterized protein LOC112053378 [Bicyclus anynana]|uniref:Uncharacterized protein LOC112053378 n=1 Tax=Bicyclus anynana TaxID=110368 RepID=A0ABM3LMD1_BICAN|nr:uncharacterized protein LOC112053378 [Bicyclus anynana]